MKTFIIIILFIIESSNLYSQEGFTLYFKIDSVLVKNQNIRNINDEFIINYYLVDYSNNISHFYSYTNFLETQYNKQNKYPIGIGVPDNKTWDWKKYKFLILELFYLKEGKNYMESMQILINIKDISTKTGSFYNIYGFSNLIFKKGYYLIDAKTITEKELQENKRSYSKFFDFSYVIQLKGAKMTKKEIKTYFNVKRELLKSD